MYSANIIVLLFCAGLAALLTGGVELYDYIKWTAKGQFAHIVLAEQGKTPARAAGEYGPYFLDVRFVDPGDGSLVVKLPFGEELAAKLANGEKIPVVYLRDNPHQIMYSRHELAAPWPLLGGGILLLTLAGYAFRQRRRMPPEARKRVDMLW
jgi:hypothetical protein